LETWLLKDSKTLLEDLETKWDKDSNKLEVDYWDVSTVQSIDSLEAEDNNNNKDVDHLNNNNVDHNNVHNNVDRPSQEHL